MKRYNLKKPEKYTVNGEEKTFWHTVGTLVIFDDGNGKVRIPAIALEAQAYPIEERDTATAPKVGNTNVDYPEMTEENTGEISDDQIPF